MENMEKMQRVLEEAKKNIEKVKEDMVKDLKQKIGNMGKENSVLGLLEARKDGWYLPVLSLGNGKKNSQVTY